MYFVELNKSIHDRNSFDCKEEELNNFIKTKASKHMEQGISKTFVLIDDENYKGKKSILAFYTITSQTISRELFHKQNYPHYPIPVFLIAQLAVDKTQQGNGIGEVTLIKALEHLLETRKYMEAVAVTVDCLNNKAEKFYKKYGFQDLDILPSGRRRLYLPMKAIEDLFNNFDKE
ncbi:MAG: GNAT family N-acetyltransferase [Candidatus Sericytochromatia bacterium]